MKLSTRLLGETVVRTLGERAAAILLTIGADTFTRSDLATVACFNFGAAANLSRCLASFEVKHTRDLFDRIPPTALAIPGLGAITLAVLGAAFERKGIGGDAPLEAWVAKHRQRSDDQTWVTFHTIKHREAQALAAERQTAKRRRHGRRDQAHRLRVDRLLAPKDVSA